MRETQLVRMIQSLVERPGRDARILRGIGDDCAVLRPGPREDLVFTTDFTIENRHFTRDSHSPAEVGHKALARSLSDLAAMGAEPVFCLVSLAIPPTFGTRWVRDFYRGLAALAARFRIDVSGGDLSGAVEAVCDVMCCGRVPRGKALLRTGARLGDIIYVTGALGVSALGLETKRGSAWRRHRRPEPRIAAGLALRGIASSAMDLSDGLSIDLLRLCRESGVSAALEETLPIARGSTLEHALHGGEDYELLFTAPARVKPPATLAGVPVTRIGVITSGMPSSVSFAGRPLKPLGFDHFR